MMVLMGTNRATNRVTIMSTQELIKTVKQLVSFQEVSHQARTSKVSPLSDL
jgi:hypothetical protein